MVKGENMESKTKPSLLKYTLIGFFILLASVVLAAVIRSFLMWDIFHLSEEKVNMIISAIEGVVAAASISMVIYQLEKGDREETIQRNIAEAQFILQYNRVFIENKYMIEVERRLEDYTFYNKKGTLINKKNRQYFVNYLVYFEGLALSVLRDELSLDHIDNLMAYRFFLIINNPEVQEKQLFEFPDYYRGCFGLYKRWKEYRVKNNKEIPQVQYSLDKWPWFERYAE